MLGSTRSCPSGSSPQRLFGGRERVQPVLVGPQQQHRHVQPRIELEQLLARARGHVRAHFAHERARSVLPGTSANAWRSRSRAAGLPRADSLLRARG